MIHTPVHASWLNQIEIFFSIIQKKVISPNDFASPGDLSATLLAFVDRYNQTARPFNWNYTATDLARFLGRINGQQQPSQPARGRMTNPDELTASPTKSAIESGTYSAGRMWIVLLTLLLRFRPCFHGFGRWGR